VNKGANISMTVWQVRITHY